MRQIREFKEHKARAEGGLQQALGSESSHSDGSMDFEQHDLQEKAPKTGEAGSPEGNGLVLDESVLEAGQPSMLISNGSSGTKEKIHEEGQH